jgi:transcriptional antiterminator NusG
MENKWYTVRVQSNRERFVSEKIKTEYSRNGEEINVLVPMEKQFYLKNGKKAFRDKIMFPGYIFVQSANTERLQEALKMIPGNSGLLRDRSGVPAVLKQHEVDKMVTDDETNKNLTLTNTLILGEIVNILGGPFDGFRGTVEEIHEDKSKVKVHVMIFGRATPVDLSMDQVSKI